MNFVHSVNNTIIDWKPFWSGAYFSHQFLQNHHANILKELDSLVHELVANHVSKKTFKELQQLYFNSLKLQMLCREYYELYYKLMGRQDFVEFSGRIGIYMYCQLIVADEIEIPYMDFKNDRELMSAISHLLY